MGLLTEDIGHLGQSYGIATHRLERAFEWGKISSTLNNFKSHSVISEK